MDGFCGQCPETQKSLKHRAANFLNQKISAEMVRRCKQNAENEVQRQNEIEKAS